MLLGFRQDAQLSQRDHAAGCVIVLAKKWKTGSISLYFRQNPIEQTTKKTQTQKTGQNRHTGEYK